jgi:hypothetical protein
MAIIWRIGSNSWRRSSGMTQPHRYSDIEGKNTLRRSFSNMKVNRSGKQPNLEFFLLKDNTMPWRRRSFIAADGRAYVWVLSTHTSSVTCLLWPRLTISNFNCIYSSSCMTTAELSSLVLTDKGLCYRGRLMLERPILRYRSQESTFAMISLSRGRLRNRCAGPWNWDDYSHEWYRECSVALWPTRLTIPIVTPSYTWCTFFSVLEFKHWQLWYNCFWWNFHIRNLNIWSSNNDIYSRISTWFLSQGLFLLVPESMRPSEGIYLQLISCPSRH